MSSQEQENHIQRQDQDYMVRALVLEGKVRVYAIRSTQTVQEAQERHQTWPTVTAALGRTLSVGAMMGAMMKGEDKLTIQVRGNGPIGKIMVDANSKGQVRGYVDNPQVHLPKNEQGKLDVGGAVGPEGAIYVNKDLGMREPYQGHSKLISGEIGEDFTVYFAQSEQTPSSVGVGVIVNPDNSVKASGGFIIQLMPGVPDDFINQLENQLKAIPPVSQLVNEGLTPEEMIKRVFVLDEVKWLDTVPVSYSCHCSYERVSQTLISLGKEELENLLQEEGKAEVNCHFCNSTYNFEREDLEQLIQEIERQK
ncbi:Hsp33 family molecular chaperone HslO [Caldalkalibacillus salinus]|uniref:Hsp33 family molecular chaperone HslO n=1 Tax=Caldalkalibacillus salinus TaxID=2803787 RepID=UPI001921DC41|nr:Hsp33 family molecular chaperone HslO [Caldalkalibacillus salinus]